MPVSMWDVFHDSLFRQCDPLIAAGRGGLDNVVRWAYTQERRDVTEFLSGGELLISDGSPLADLDDEARGRYVDALADAGASGLAIELVDYFREVPAALARRADERNLPIIGLRRRLPFVDLCQEINTRIVREQILSRMEWDNLSTSLRRGLAAANSAQDVAGVLFRVLGESVVIFDTSCAIVACAGLDVGAPASWKEQSFVLMPVSADGDGTVVATVGVSQRFSIMDAAVREAICTELDRSLPSFMPRSIESKIRMRLLDGARNGMYATDEEVREAGEMMRALGFLTGAHCFVFALVFAAPDPQIPRFAERLRSMARSDGETGRSDVLFMMSGNAIYGCFLSDDALMGSARFNEQCRTALTTFLSLNVWVVAGVTVTGAAGLLNGLAALRAVVARRRPNYAHITPLNDDVFDRMLAVERTDDAVSMLIGQIAGRLLPADAVLTDTLCALAECAGSKTEACVRLGITRQTLYNRLDKVTEVTGVEQRDRKGWDSLLAASRLIVARRGRA